MSSRTRTCVLRTPEADYQLTLPASPLPAGAPFYCHGHDFRRAHESFIFKCAARTGRPDTDSRLKAVFSHEAAMLNKVSHRFVAKCLKSGQGMIELNGKVHLTSFLMLESLPSKSLLDLVETEKAKDIFRSLVEAVDYLHGQGVALRGGLSLESVQFDERTRELKIFNLADAVELRGSSEADKAHDVFTLGKLLFALQTGRYPFENGSQESGWKRLFYSHTRMRYWETVAQQVSDLSVPFINVINAMLESDQRLRISTGKLLKHPYVCEP